MKKKDLDYKCTAAKQNFHRHGADSTAPAGVAFAVIATTGGLAAHKFAITKMDSSLASNGDT